MPEKTILDCLLKHHRGLTDDHRTCPECFRTTLDRIAFWVRRAQPIHFVLPAFPAKSPNTRKVLGVLPDYGEIIGLKNLNQICNEITGVYAPGARITICTDGLIFSDLVGIPDATVGCYQAEISKIITDFQLANLAVFSLSDVAPNRLPPALREWCIQKYAPSVEEIRLQIIGDLQTRDTFNGMARFVFEDLVYMRAGETRSKMRKQAKGLTYKMMQRSISWGALVAEHYPHAVRLSVHPQGAHSAKFGIQLMPTSDNWLTPWHGVVAKIEHEIALCKRHQVEALGGTLVYEGQRPSHYVLTASQLVSAQGACFERALPPATLCSGITLPEQYRMIQAGAR